MTDNDDTTAWRANDDGLLVERARAGDRNAFGELYDRWFDRVLDHAYQVLGDEHAAADVAYYTFVEAWQSLDHLDDPNAVGGWLLHIARQQTAGRPRRPHRVRPTDAEDRIRTVTDPAQIAGDFGCIDLLWSAVDVLDERDRDLADLNLRHGLTPDQVADVLEIDRATAVYQVPRARQRLATAITARLLWRSGQPLCAPLRAELVDADVESFDPEAVRVIGRHADGCAECSERRHTELGPEQLFAAAPMLVLPNVKQQIAYGLSIAGVPMSGSVALTGSRRTTRAQRRTERKTAAVAATAVAATAGSGAGKPLNAKKRRQRWIIAGGIAGVIVIASIVAAFSYGGKPKKIVAVIPKVTTTTKRKATTTTLTSTSTTSTSTSTTTVPVVVPPTPPPTLAPTTTVPPTTTTIVPITATFTLQPDTVATGYDFDLTKGPLLQWSVANAAKVHVTDSAQKIDSTQPSGKMTVCPGNSSATTCNADPGPYVYTLDVFNKQNVRVLHRTLTLTITTSPPP